MSVGLRDVRDIVAGTLRDVETISTSPVVMRELLGDLRNAERILGKKLRDHALKHGSLDSRFAGAQALSMQGPVLQAIDYIQDRIRGRTAVQAEAAIGQGLTRTVTTMEGLEQRFTGIATPVRLRQAAEMSTAKANARGMWARDFPTSVDRYGVKMMSEFEEIIRAGFVAGSSMDEVIAAITGHGGPTGMVSMSAKITPAGVLRVRESDIPEGLFVRHKYWAERLVRTEMLKAYNGARQAGLEQMGSQFPDMNRKILATLDKRTAKDSLAVHGQIRGLKDPFVDGAGRVYMYPPARPNDRETVIPWRKSWEASSENLSEWEKAAIGEEPDLETERRLEAMLTGKAKPAKAAKPKAAGSTTKAVTPMTKKSPPTINQQIEAQLRKELRWTSNGALTGGSTPFGHVGKQWAPGTYTPNGKWVAYHHDPATQRGIQDVFDTKELAQAHLTGIANARLAKAAQSIKKWDEKAYFDAVAADDPVTARHYVRGLLYENGVMPRDFLRADYDVHTIEPTSSMPEALASHGWGGRVRTRQDVWDDGKSPDAPRRAAHLATSVHEELHGSTKFDSASFYQGHGAVLEEVSVEMAARHITQRAMPAFRHTVEGYAGSYQRIIDQVTQIVVDSERDIGNVIDPVEAKKRIALAGIAMRSAKGAGSPIKDKGGILRLFTKHAVSKGAQKGAQTRIKRQATRI